MLRPQRLHHKSIKYHRVTKVQLISHETTNTSPLIDKISPHNENAFSHKEAKGLFELVSDSKFGLFRHFYNPEIFPEIDTIETVCKLHQH